LSRAYAYYDNLKYLLQRLAAIGVQLFLEAHLWLAMIHPRLVPGHPEPFSDIAFEMRFHTPTLKTRIQCGRSPRHRGEELSGLSRIRTWDQSVMSRFRRASSRSHTVTSLCFISR
jgi:hypothetical protein